MGNSESNGSIRPPTASANKGVNNALQRCESTLEMLNHSMSTLSIQETKYWEDAAKARDNHDLVTAATLVRAAQRVAADCRAVRTRYGAIERQKSMIQQQQMNMMLTNVLVDTSRVLKQTQEKMGSAASNVDGSVDIYTDIYDQMSEITESLEEGEMVAARHADTDTEQLMELLNAKKPPEKTPTVSVPTTPSTNSRPSDGPMPPIPEVPETVAEVMTNAPTPPKYVETTKETAASPAKPVTYF